MWHFKTYTVANHFLAALINGDITGLSDEEAKQVEEFQNAVGRVHTTNGHWDCGHGSDFATCEICLLKADTTEIQYCYKLVF